MAFLLMRKSIVLAAMKALVMYQMPLYSPDSPQEYYMVQNSWGESGDYKGIWYMTKAFIAANTMDFLINKNAIPAEIRKKLGL